MKMETTMRGILQLPGLCEARQEKRRLVECERHLCLADPKKEEPLMMMQKRGEIPIHNL